MSDDLFDPILHEWVLPDGSNVIEGDQITLFMIVNEKQFWASWRKIIRFERGRREVILEDGPMGGEGNHLLTRDPGSIFKWAKLLKTKTYDLDQQLDEEEDLL